MSEQKTAKKTEEAPKEQDTTKSEKVDTTGINDLLDDIDDVLEENAEEFVKNFVQRGGE